MMIETVHTEQMWRLLWSHASYQVISAVPIDNNHEAVCAGYGWGIRRADDRRSALLVHPTANDREVGELSLTILGVGTQVIPRCDSDFPQYLNAVRDVVETTIDAYL